MKTIILAIVAASLSACSSQTEGWKIDGAQKICETRGGIDHLNTFLSVLVICHDGFSSFIEPKK